MDRRDVFADLIDRDREPGLCPSCGCIAFPMRSWVQYFPTRGMIMKKHWLCNCGFRNQDLTLFDVFKHASPRRRQK